jgi:hypothetical protein
MLTVACGPDVGVVEGKVRNADLLGDEGLVT